MDSTISNCGTGLVVVAILLTVAPGQTCGGQ